MKKLFLVITLLFAIIIGFSFETFAAIPLGVTFEATYVSYGNPYSFTTEDIYDNANGKLSLIVNTEI